MTTMTESRPPARGQQHSYVLDPPPEPHCRVRWLIGGREVARGETVGGLEVKGFGASGQMTVEVVGDASATTVTAKIHCGGDPETVGPMPVGSGSWERPPVGAGTPLDPAEVTFSITEWPWWNRMFGGCPGTLWIGDIRCTCPPSDDVAFAPVYSGPWPLAYSVTCIFKCSDYGLKTLTWRLSFGFVTGGPD